MQNIKNFLQVNSQEILNHLELRFKGPTLPGAILVRNSLLLLSQFLRCPISKIIIPTIDLEWIPEEANWRK